MIWPELSSRIVLFRIYNWLDFLRSDTVVWYMYYENTPTWFIPINNEFNENNIVHDPIWSHENHLTCSLRTQQWTANSIDSSSNRYSWRKFNIFHSKQKHHIYSTEGFSAIQPIIIDFLWKKADTVGEQKKKKITRINSRHWIKCSVKVK